MMRIPLAVSIICAGLLAACGPGAAPAPQSVYVASTAPAPLVGTAWTLVNLRGRDLDPPPSRGAPTLRFAADRVSGFAGCNQYFANYELEGARLTFREIGATRMACPGDDAMELERAFIDALGTVTRWERSGSTLTLSSEQGVVARFRLGGG